MLRRCALAVVAGLLLAGAFEPVTWPVLLVPAVAGYVVSVHGLRPRKAFWPALAFGVAFYFTHIIWMTAVAWAAWVGLAAVEALFYGLLGPVVAAFSARRGAAWTVPAAWVAMEVVRSGFPFSGMPWGRLAFAVVDTPVAPSLAYVGMVGTSFLLAAAGSQVGLLWARDRGRGRLPTLAALVVVAAAALLPALHPVSFVPDGEVTVAAVQGDVPGPGNDVLYDFRGVTANHVDATVKLAREVAAGERPKPAFVLWPENSTAVDPFSDAQTHAGIERAVSAIGVPVVVGAIVDGPREGTILNQGIVWSPTTGAGDRYTKHHPVPYGEYIPWRKYLNLQFGQLALVRDDMLAGTRKEPLRVAGVPVADAICFDVAYDDELHDQLVRGARMVTVQTSNATFVFTDQLEQQFAITRLRAIESGRWTVVASTNGISGIIAPDGHVVATAPRQTTAVLEHTVGLSSKITPGTYVGPWVARACLAVTGLGILLLAALAYRRRHSRRAGRSDEAPDGTDPSPAMTATNPSRPRDTEPVTTRQNAAPHVSESHP